tara:strand:+ start:63 stop:251 length:189 start_codon:yes stop_codon:yes gene_type:complete
MEVTKRPINTLTKIEINEAFDICAKKYKNQKGTTLFESDKKMMLELSFQLGVISQEKYNEFK